MAKHIKYYLNDLREHLKTRGERPGIEIRTMPELNRKIWGITRGKVYVVGARPSNGKSAFILQVGMDVASQGIPVLILSLEMEILQNLERAFCQYGGVNNTELLAGRFGMYEGAFNKFYEDSGNINLVIEDAIGKTWEEIDGYLSKLKVKPQVVIIDHIHEIKRSGVNERGMIDEYLRRFKEMAIRYNFAGMVCSQINRTSSEDKNNRRPEVHQLKSSGYLEEFADFVILLHYPYKLRISKNRNEFHLFVDKNRNGPTGHIQMHFVPEHYKFYEIEKKQLNQREQEKEEWT